MSLRTLKPRQRCMGRSSADEKITRIMQLLDASYVDQLRRFLATFRPGRQRPLFDISRKTAWLQLAVECAKEKGIEFSYLPSNPRRSGTALLCTCSSIIHRRKWCRPTRYESMEVYLKVFALGMAPQLGVTYSLAHREYRHLLMQK